MKLLAPALLGLVCLGAHSADTWNFNPPKDAFSDQALLDLRSLNEAVAGETGFIRLSKDGNDFVRGDGKPIRFWAMNSGAHSKHPKFPAPDLDRHARFMAKRGINMTRFHGNVTPRNGNIDEVNRGELDGLWRTVAAMKKAGIYTTFSPYWANSSQIKAGQNGILANEAGNSGLLFFDQRLQQAYKAWWKTILTEPNPYTGIPLKDDPALALLQLQNEDSLLFWTSQGIKGPAGTELRKRFARFAAEKHGSVEKAIAAWGGAKLGGDTADELELHIVWQLTKDGNVTKSGSEGEKARAADQAHFMAKVMYDFNAMMKDYLQKELGAKQIINAGNWKTADNVVLNDLERWSYSANEVQAVNRYYTGLHIDTEKRYEGWAIVNGQFYTDPSVLTNPREFPLTLRLVAGAPMLITESSWVPPLAKQSEGPFLIAAYQSLTGFDGYYWFATGDEDWTEPKSANGYLPSLGKWIMATPMLLGQFPANALALRTNLIKEGKPVVQEARSLDSLWRREVPIIAEDAGFDPNRDQGDGLQLAADHSAVNQLAYLAGPVTVTYGEGKTEIAKDLDTLVTKDVVTSITGELKWNHQVGFATVDAPAIQGVTGFLAKAGPQQLKTVKIESTNDYATVVCVALDGKPLATSAKILIQVGTEARPTDWKAEAAKIPLDKGKRHVDGMKITNYGKAPWQVVATQATVSIANSKLTTARVCDVNFMQKGTVDLAREGKGVKVTLPADAMYVVLTAE